MLALAMEQDLGGNSGTQWRGSVHMGKKERIMDTGNAAAEEVVLSRLQRYEFDTFFKGHI